MFYKKRISFIVIFFFIFSILLLFTGCEKEVHSSKIPPKAEKGVIDLKEWEFETDGMIKLDGEWEFYWQKFIEPEKFNMEKDNITAYINVPGYWNDLSKDGKPLNLENDGYATYRLKVNFKDSRGRLAFKLYNISTASKIWVDGQLIYEAGKIGKSKNESKPGFKAGVYEFEYNNNSVEIVVHVSNYFYFHSGIWDSISLGTVKQAIAKKDAFNFTDTITFSGVVLLIIYYLCFYLFRRKEITSLLFSIVCVGVLFRTVIANESIFRYLFGDNFWEIERKIEYLGMSFTCGFYPYLLHKMFPGKRMNKFVKVFFVFNMILSAFTIIFPTRIFTILLPLYQISILFALFSVIILITSAAFKRQENSLLLLVGALTFTGTTIHDILYHNKVINTFDIGSVGFLVLLLSNALVLARRFANSFTMVEKLSEDLRKSNKKIMDTFEAVTSTSVTINKLIENIYHHCNDINSASRLISQAMLDNSECLCEESDSISTGVKSLQTLVNEINTVTQNTSLMTEKSFATMQKVLLESEKMNKMIQHVNRIDNFMNQLNKTMEKIYSQSTSINKIVDIVSKISKQTKLLSINASIEASKAQKYGKGFSVIASDIKKLSDHTQDSIHTIKQFILDINKDIIQAREQAAECVQITQEGELFVKEAVETFKEVETNMSLINQNTNSIDAESKKVLNLADNIFNMFNTILETSNTIAAAIQEVTASTESQNSDFDEIVKQLEGIIVHVKYLNDRLHCEVE